MTHFCEFLQSELISIKEASLYRKLRFLEGEQSPIVVIDGKEVILLCSNNYLGLANHPGLKKLVKEAVDKYGCSAGSSRLISGNMDLHERLEQQVARFKGAKASLVFNTGYMANLGIIQALAQREDVIFSDELNHASIIDGCRLSKAKVMVFPHKDLNFLEECLKESFRFKRRLIVTESVFSMDGDIAPLPQIVELARKYGAIVMLDEAHATGVIGKEGRGAMEYFGLENDVDVVVGTFGKALGSFGAYVCGSLTLREYLINTCRSFIFTTALPPAALASSIAAIQLVEGEPKFREKLWYNVRYLRKELKQLGFHLSGQTQIIPLIIGDEALTMGMTDLLLKEGVFVQGIRTPTVPRGASRLRITVTSAHTKNNLDEALKAFARVGKKLNII